MQSLKYVSLMIIRLKSLEKNNSVGFFKFNYADFPLLASSSLTTVVKYVYMNDNIVTYIITLQLYNATYI